jgi:UDP-3-O-[3-hydroxymyristoyl] N-acetylglucosamine deacetylase
VSALRRQRTLRRPVSIEGVGLHSGLRARARVVPAPPGHGRVFVRADLAGGPAIPAEARWLNGATGRQTVLDRDGVRIATSEHLLAALAALEIDNAIVEVHGEEVPDAGDGSAGPFVTALLGAGLVEQDTAIDPLVVETTISVGENESTLRAEPADVLTIACTYEHALVGRQEAAFRIDPDVFARQIAPARTFGFLHEVEALRAQGLARGGSLENAVVVGPGGPVGGQTWRFPDECVRHKILDLVGDLALVGRPVCTRITAVRSGHRLNAELVKALVRRGEDGASGR